MIYSCSSGQQSSPCRAAPGKADFLKGGKDLLLARNSISLQWSKHSESLGYTEAHLFQLVLWIWKWSSLVIRAPAPLQYLPTCLLLSDIAIPFVSRGNRGWVFTVAIQMRELNQGKLRTWLWYTAQWGAEIPMTALTEQNRKPGHGPKAAYCFQGMSSYHCRIFHWQTQAPPARVKLARSLWPWLVSVSLGLFEGNHWPSFQKSSCQVTTQISWPPYYLIFQELYFLLFIYFYIWDDQSFT